VLDEAIRTFGREGWSGFSIEKIAQHSGTGKASIYSRWKTKEALLVAALSDRVAVIEDIDTGSLRQDLVSLGWQAIDLFLGPAGPAARRLPLEQEIAPSLQPFTSEWSRSRVRAARAIVTRGVGRGELSSDASVEFIINTVWGGATNFASTQTPRSRTTAHERGRAYVEQLVDLLLAGVEQR